MILEKAPITIKKEIFKELGQWTNEGSQTLTATEAYKKIEYGTVYGIRMVWLGRTDKVSAQFTSMTTWMTKNYMADYTNSETNRNTEEVAKEMLQKVWKEYIEIPEIKSLLKEEPKSVFSIKNLFKKMR